jgi:hypothetical protein
LLSIPLRVNAPLVTIDGEEDVMSKATGPLLKMLADTHGGWVNRRDGLGRVAQSAIKGLKAHEKDSDEDVRSGVVTALQAISHALAGVDMSVAPGGLPTLEKLVNALVKPGHRDLTTLDDGYSMKVITKNMRAQTVLIHETTSNTQMDIVRVSTVCAKADPASFEWALKNNVSMSHCALGVEERDGEDSLVLTNNLLAKSLSFAELKLSVKEVAFYGDWIEEKLSGIDHY